MAARETEGGAIGETSAIDDASAAARGLPYHRHLTRTLENRRDEVAARKTRQRSQTIKFLIRHPIVGVKGFVEVDIDAHREGSLGIIEQSAEMKGGAAAEHPARDIGGGNRRAASVAGQIEHDARHPIIFDLLMGIFDEGKGVFRRIRFARESGVIVARARGEVIEGDESRRAEFLIGGDRGSRLFPRRL